MKKKKGSSTSTAGMVVVALSVCCGLLFGVVVGPMCWHCWSWNTPLIPGKPFVFLSSPEQVYYCQTCASVWKIGEPWNSMSFNPNAIPHKAVEEAEAKRAAEEWEREKNAPEPITTPNAPKSHLEAMHESAAAGVKPGANSNKNTGTAAVSIE